MKKIVKLNLFVILIFAFASVVYAGKPAPVDENDPYIGNGFPSGPHYNLNLIAKEIANFSCPPPTECLMVIDDGNNDGDLFTCVDPQEGCDLEDTCVERPVYGNVIFFQRDPCTWDEQSERYDCDPPISILMESGRKGPKPKEGEVFTETLEVYDWCTEAFDDSPAMLRLPKNEDGYAVYARITGKPDKIGTGPRFNAYPEPYYVEDESGNDLIMLGFVDENGVFVWESGIPDGGLVRVNDSKPGRGVKKATNITRLFLWSGEVCYIQEDADLYCLEDGVDQCTSTQDLCCVDNDPNTTGYERCDPLDGVDGVGVDDGNGSLVCPATDFEGYVYYTETARCREYTEHWIFNIADYVGYLWDVTTTGAYVIQVRFYPLPLNTK